MSSESHPEAWRCVYGARWRLLESYALARQEGLASPVGLVADLRHPRAVQVLRQLMLAPNTGNIDPLYAGCVERGALCAALMPIAPKLAELMFSRGDEAGAWTALVLQDEEVVLSATWQELISGTTAGASVGQRRERGR
ncbi:MAG TPA: hypothetical protein VJV79_17660 [Polyangiaceae bacterium]|nr:hypothetical protein [Polyangiaceae bacterium]